MFQFLSRRLFCTNDSNDDDDKNNNEWEGRNESSNDEVSTTTTTTNTKLEPMANLYSEWTYEQDQMLWEHYNNYRMSTSELAALLGRGLRGVEARLAKLKDSNTQAYERLFADYPKIPDGRLGRRSNIDEEGTRKKKKLVPAAEIIRRIQWDISLVQNDFSIQYYDRVDDTIMEVPFDAPNTSIGGTTCTQFVQALPEHRIMSIKYKERIVWDREKRFDLVSSSSSSVSYSDSGEDGGGIANVIRNYEEWKRNKDEMDQWNKQRQAMVSERLRIMLGLDLFQQLKQLASDLQSSVKHQSVSKKIEAEKFVQQALQIFRTVREDPMLSVEPSLIPMSDYMALDCLSEMVALLPDHDLRTIVLAEVSFFMNQGGQRKTAVQPTQSKQHEKKREDRRGEVQQQLPELLEDDIMESFVRGTGPGGQKINKTNNRVILVHNPTQLRVECQDTRSLQQNRKIARKRLRLKLDEYINGSQSRTSIKAQQASMKRSKAKARNKARQKKKRLQKQQQQQEQQQNQKNDGDDDITTI